MVSCRTHSRKQTCLFPSWKPGSCPKCCFPCRFLHQELLFLPQPRNVSVSKWGWHSPCSLTQPVLREPVSLPRRPPVVSRPWRLPALQPRPSPVLRRHRALPSPASQGLDTSAVGGVGRLLSTQPSRPRPGSSQQLAGLSHKHSVGLGLLSSGLSLRCWAPSQPPPCRPVLLPAYSPYQPSLSRPPSRSSPDSTVSPLSCSLAGSLFPISPRPQVTHLTQDTRMLGVAQASL